MAGSGSSPKTPAYTVRNTFIDLAPAPEEDLTLGGYASIFGTWPCAQVLRKSDTTESPEPEEGEVREHDEPQASAAPLTDQREEGEVSDDDDDDDELEEDGPTKKDPSSFSVSYGSADHGTGQCRPCAWLHKSAEGCRHGENCEYCHLCPPGEIKRRKRDKLVSRALEARQKQLHLEEVRWQKLEQAKQRLSSAQPQTSEPPPPPLFAAPLLMERVPEPPVPEQPPTMAAIGAQAVAAALAAAAENRPVHAMKPAPRTFPAEAPALEPCYVVPALAGPAALSAPRAANVGTPSIGSAGHASGACKPCVWLHKDSGCRHGSNCFYCHLCPSNEVRRRKQQKNKIMRVLKKSEADENSSMF